MQLEKLRKGMLSKEEREALFRKLREIAAYWTTHKEELAKQKSAWLGAKGTTITKIGKLAPPAPSTAIGKPTLNKAAKKMGICIAPSKSSTNTKMAETKIKSKPSSKKSNRKKIKK